MVLNILHNISPQPFSAANRTKTSASRQFSFFSCPIIHFHLTYTDFADSIARIPFASLPGLQLVSIPRMPLDHSWHCTFGYFRPSTSGSCPTTHIHTAHLGPIRSENNGSIKIRDLFSSSNPGTSLLPISLPGSVRLLLLFPFDGFQHFFVAHSHVALHIFV